MYANVVDKENWIATINNEIGARYRIPPDDPNVSESTKLTNQSDLENQMEFLFGVEVRLNYRLISFIDSGQNLSACL